MAKLRVHNNAWVLIGDGRKCLILHNQGDAELLDLRRVSVRAAPSEPTREQGRPAFVWPDDRSCGLVPYLRMVDDLLAVKGVRA